MAGSFVFFSSRRRHTRYWRDWSSDVCSSDLHHQLDRVEAVRAQIVDKAGILGYLGFVDAEMLDDDLLDPLGDVAHSIFPRLCAVNWLDSARSGYPIMGSAAIRPPS